MNFIKFRDTFEKVKYFKIFISQIAPSKLLTDINIKELK